MKMKKMLATVAVAAAVVSLSVGEVENQERQITVVVTQVPTGLASSGSPIPNARVEYIEDGAENSTAVVSTTDANGSITIAAGNPGVVTASKSGFTTISIGYDRDSSSTLRIARAPGYAPTIASTTLIAGDAHSTDIGMLLEGSVSGSVVDSHSNAVANALVEVEYHGFTDSDLLSTGIGGYVMTDDDGLFFVTGIVPNEGFSIYAELENGNRSDVQSLTTAPGATLQNITLTLN